jgi:GTPase SAR1 family protein
MVCFKNTVKCTILGDGMVGKTCLAKAFVGDQFPDRYVATVTGNYTGGVKPVIISSP